MTLKFVAVLWYTVISMLFDIWLPVTMRPEKAKDTFVEHVTDVQALLKDIAKS